MNNNGELINPNADYKLYFMTIGCIACVKYTDYDLDPTLKCGGTFNVCRNEPYEWVFDKWTCPPPPPPQTDKKDRKMEINTENVRMFEPASPAKMLQEWFENESDDNRKRFLEQTKFTEQSLGEIFSNKISIDQDVAKQLSLSEKFGKEAEFWYWMQLNYDEYYKTGHEIDRSLLPRIFP